MFIVDFDDTLFNTRPGFMEARLAAVSQLGVSLDDFDRAREALRNMGDGNYTSARHAEMLGTYGFDPEKIRVALDSVMIPERLSALLLPDALSFLEQLKAFGEPMILLSLGDEEFQYAKVHGTGIEHFFDRIFFVNDTKEHVVRELLGNVSDATAWFVNDRVDQTEAIALTFPRLHCVLKESPAGGTPEYYAKSGFPHFKTLTEIYDYIRTNR